MYKIVKPNGTVIPVYITDEDSHSIKIHLVTDVSLCRWMKRSEYHIRDDLILIKN